MWTSGTAHSVPVAGDLDRLDLHESGRALAPPTSVTPIHTYADRNRRIDLRPAEAVAAFSGENPNLSAYSRSAGTCRRWRGRNALAAPGRDRAFQPGPGNPSSFRLIADGPVASPPPLSITTSLISNLRSTGLTDAAFAGCAAVRRAYQRAAVALPYRSPTFRRDAKPPSVDRAIIAD